MASDLCFLLDIKLSCFFIHRAYLIYGDITREPTTLTHPSNSIGRFLNKRSSKGPISVLIYHQNLVVGSNSLGGRCQASNTIPLLGRHNASLPMSLTPRRNKSGCDGERRNGPYLLRLKPTEPLRDTTYCCTRHKQLA